MTTIFADAVAGVMVCDSKMTLGNEWVSVTKVHRVGDELVGLSGFASEGDRWLEWYRDGQKGACPKVPNTNALILGPKGLFLLESNGAMLRVERGFLGSGSGGSCATAAFLAGVDAETAVHIACQVDANSGGDVVVHTLKDSK